MNETLSKWLYWRALYVETFCVAQGLSPKTLQAYRDTLRRFNDHAAVHWPGREPDRVTARDVLEYIEYLRRERGNGDAAVNRAVTILKNFFRAMVSMGHMEPRDNPMAHFPKVKKPSRKLPEVLTEQEVPLLLAQPRKDTIIGLRDCALLTLLYGTGIRASECSGLDEKDLDLVNRTVRVKGKGGHERTVPLNDMVVKAMRVYLEARGAHRSGALFVSRKGKRMSRNTIYERVRTHARKARIQKKVSPHRLRHAFATHLVRNGVNLMTIRDLLGHRQITSTQIYLHMTAQDLREAADRHPIGALVDTIKDLLPDVRLRFQTPPMRRTG
jgi:integrase/recombinase XerD